MSRKNRTWLIICIILFLPWLVRVPRHLQKQILKLELPLTWPMTPAERKIHFLKEQMEELDDDYFALLRATDEYRAGRRISFRFIMPPNLSEEEQKAMMVYRGFARRYASYWLSPCRPPKRDETSEVELYYRHRPSVTDEKVLAKISGPQPSYLVEATP